MALMGRMYLAMSMLFGILFSFFMVMIYLLQLPVLLATLLAMLLSVGIVLLQWAISPAIIRWIYKIQAADLESFPPSIRTYITDTCRDNSIPVPTLGIIEDGNPNAFAFGRTRNSASLVVTRGVFNYCDEEEQKAVIAHEMGHIVHNDFVVMTIVAMVPLILYIIFRGALNSMRYARGGGKKGNAAAVLLVIAVSSYLAYVISQFIALLVSRFREYYADDFSARSTRNPNALSSALIKIAYGLAREGKAQQGDQRKARSRQARFESNALMFFDARSARALAVESSYYGGESKQSVKKVMSWDLWNPWAFFMELSMTHPLPAKRIQALGKVASELGQVPFIEFDLKQPETYWDDFLGDVLARGAWAFSIPLAILVFWWYSPLGWVSFLLALASFLTVAPLLGIAYLRLYKYPGGFKGARIKDLLEDPKASPVRGTPVELTGRIIGRGVPGLFYSEDIKMDDGTGIILLDYNQVLGIINFFVGVFQTPDWLDRPVVARGWYRRRVVPYVELLEMTVGDRKHHLWNPGAQVALCLIVLLFGIWVDILAIGAL